MHCFYQPIWHLLLRLCHLLPTCLFVLLLLFAVTGCSTPVLLSGAADNTIRVWAWHGQKQSPPWTCITVLQVRERQRHAVTDMQQHCTLLVFKQQWRYLASSRALYAVRPGFSHQQRCSSSPSSVSIATCPKAACMNALTLQCQSNAHLFLLSCPLHAMHM
jgi:hypothetical protein